MILCFIFSVDAVKVCYEPLLKSKNFEKIRSEFKQLLEMNPKNDLLGSMHLLVCLNLIKCSIFFLISLNSQQSIASDDHNDYVLCYLELT